MVVDAEAALVDRVIQLEHRAFTQAQLRHPAVEFTLGHHIPGAVVTQCLEPGRISLMPPGDRIKSSGPGEAQHEVSPGVVLLRGQPDRSAG